MRPLDSPSAVKLRDERFSLEGRLDQRRVSHISRVLKVPPVVLLESVLKEVGIKCSN